MELVADEVTHGYDGHPAPRLRSFEVERRKAYREARNSLLLPTGGPEWPPRSGELLEGADWSSSSRAWRSFAVTGSLRSIGERAFFAAPALSEYRWLLPDAKSS